MSPLLILDLYVRGYHRYGTYMFLLDLKGVELADCDAVDSGRLNHRAGYWQKVKESLRQRFKKEHLG